MTEGQQQQPQQAQQQQAQQQQQQQGQQQESPLRRLERALTGLRRVQNLLEMSYPNQTEAIRLQREAGDLIWQIIQESLQQQQQRQQGS